MPDGEASAFGPPRAPIPAPRPEPAELSHDSFMRLLRRVVGEVRLVAALPVWFHCGAKAMRLPSFYAASFAAQDWHRSTRAPLTVFALTARQRVPRQLGMSEGEQ